MYVSKTAMSTFIQHCHVISSLNSTKIKWKSFIRLLLNKLRWARLKFLVKYLKYLPKYPIQVMLIYIHKSKIEIESKQTHFKTKSNIISICNASSWGAIGNMSLKENLPTEQNWATFQKIKVWSRVLVNDSSPITETISTWYYPTSSFFEQGNK